jgi:hypothetical protein
MLLLKKLKLLRLGYRFSFRYKVVIVFGLKSLSRQYLLKHCAAGATMVGGASLTTVTFCIAIQPLASFTYTSHDKLVKFVSTESTGLLPYAPQVAQLLL